MLSMAVFMKADRHLYMHVGQHSQFLERVQEGFTGGGRVIHELALVVRLGERLDPALVQFEREHVRGERDGEHRDYADDLHPPAGAAMEQQRTRNSYSPHMGQLRSQQPLYATKHCNAINANRNKSNTMMQISLEFYRTGALQKCG